MAEEPKLREISKAELQDILEKHKIWVESGGKEGVRADLSKTNLQEAYLKKANLQMANLRKANLPEAYLKEADLRMADLERANLNGAELLDANLKEANLKNADLTDAKNLLASQLAGLDLTGAKLPDDIHKFEGPLSVVGEASKNARNLFFAMLLACAYVLLTVATTTDRALVLNDATSTLPIIGTSIPIVYFYWTAPFLLLAIYAYFHLYLLRMFENMADLPAVFPDGRPLHKKIYPWLLSGLVCKYFKELKKNRPPLSSLQVLLSNTLGWCFVPLTLAVMWLRYLSKHDDGWILIHFLTFAFSMSAGLIFFKHMAETLKGNETKNIFFKTFNIKKFAIRVPSLFTIAVTTVFPITFAAWMVLSFGYQKHWGANLTEQDLSVKPPNWTERDPAKLDLVVGARLDFARLESAKAYGAFLAKAFIRKAHLEGADLSYAHLKGAKLWYTNLEGATLSSTNLMGTGLTYASLKGATLSNAQFGVYSSSDGKISTDIRFANLSGVTGLTQAQLENAWGNHSTVLPRGYKRPAHWK